MNHSCPQQGAECEGCREATRRTLAAFVRAFWLPIAAGATLAVWSAFCQWLTS